MEKRRPTYDLVTFKAAFGPGGRGELATVAVRDVRALGFDRSGIVRVIQSMERRHFYKSMTSYGDHAEWQDVYHVPCQGMVLYVKFVADLVAEFKVLSFKEK